MKIDVRTPSEKMRDEKHKRICNEYTTLINNIPKCKPNRVLSIVAEKYSMSIPGVKNIVKKNGLYKI